jgi:hypothetical protein
MSYTKPNVTITGVASAVAAALAQNSVFLTIGSLADELVAAGGVVPLDTGDVVWESCIVHDRPETPPIDQLTVALACASYGTPRVKGNGQQVAQVFWSSVWPDQLAVLGIDTVRKALMMVALGEPQPQVPIPNPDPEPAPQTQDALPMAAPEAHSIRSQISAADQLAAPLADVL